MLASNLRRLNAQNRGIKSSEKPVKHFNSQIAITQLHRDWLSFQTPNGCDGWYACAVGYVT